MSDQLKHLFAKVECDCTADYFALTYIMKSETEQASARIQ